MRPTSSHSDPSEPGSWRSAPLAPLRWCIAGVYAAHRHRDGAQDCPGRRADTRGARELSAWHVLLPFVVRRLGAPPLTGVRHGELVGSFSLAAGGR